MLTVGVFGAGHLGKIHLQQWLEVENAAVAGFYDPNDEHAQQAIDAYGVTRFSDAAALIARCDVIDIVTNTPTHFSIAREAILAGKHIFIEKPLTHTIEEAQELVKLVQEANVKCQVGHVERYNPAFLALKNQPLHPMFIETHRLAQFNPRGTDVAVILDLMIHDLDIILHLVPSSIRRISASGVSVMSDTPDIANARIEFDNGCVANLTASRISMKKMRKMRLFQRDAYIGIDFLEKKTEIIRLKDTLDPTKVMDFAIELGNGSQKVVSIEMPEIQATNAIRMELQAFTNAVINDTPTEVGVHDGYQSMDVAHQIIKKMSLHNQAHQL